MAGVISRCMTPRSCVGQPVGTLSGDLDRVINGQRSFPLQPSPEQRPLHVGHDVVKKSPGFARVVERKDVGVGQTGDGVDLTEEALGADGVGHLGSEHLESQLAVVLRVRGQEDGGHAAGAQLPDERVAVAEVGFEAGPEIGRGRWLLPIGERSYAHKIGLGEVRS